MQTISYISMSMNASKEMSLTLINDLKDQPFAQPTSNGGNHATWILGHLAYMESVMIHQMIQGKDTCTLSHLKAVFDAEGAPSTDASLYPSFDQLLKEYDTARNETDAYLETISETDLQQPALGCLDDWKPYFGTIAQCLDFIAHHPSLHFGQLADIRKSLGRKPIFG